MKDEHGHAHLSYKQPVPLILASQSPRRLELLRRLVPTYIPSSSDVEEAGSEDYPEERLQPLPLPSPFLVPHDYDPRLWAWRKAVDAARSLDTTGHHVILAADTVVVGPGEVLNKPSDAEDALRMLRLLRGRAHYVVTGFALLTLGSNALPTSLVDAVITEVVMRDFTEAQLQGYLVTGEPFDKAGAYALQGLGGELVDEVRGCATNVIGLPLCRVREALSQLGLDLLPYPTRGYCAFCSHLPAG